MDGLKDARAMLSAGIIGGPCRDAKWRFGRNVGRAVRSASLSPAPVKLTGFQLQSASQASCFQSTSCGISLALCTSSTNQARYALSEDSCPKGGASCSGLGSGGCHSILAPRVQMAPKNIWQQAAQHQ